MKPQSRQFRRGIVGLFGDGRLEPAKHMRRLRVELLEHLGPAPTVTQAQMVDLALSDYFQFWLFQQRLTEKGKLTPHERREMSAARGRYEKTLMRLGLKGSPVSRQSTMDAIEFGRMLAAGEVT